MKTVARRPQIKSFLPPHKYPNTVEYLPRVNNGRHSREMPQVGAGHRSLVTASDAALVVLSASERLNHRFSRFNNFQFKYPLLAAQSKGTEMFRQTAPKKEMTKSEMIELIVVRTPVRTSQEQQQLRKDLSAYSTEELGLYIHLELAEDRFHEVLAERAAEQLRYHLQMREAREPQRLAEEKLQLEADRKTFIQAAKTLQSFGVTEANLNVTRSVLGPGFSTYDIQQALGSNALQLSEATQAELSEWTREAKETEIKRLKSMDLLSLRKLVRDEGARGPVTPPLDETQRVRQAERDAATVYENLPPDISAEDILGASVSKLSFLKQKYGNAQLDAVLNDYRQANAVIDKF